LSNKGNKPAIERRKHPRFGVVGRFPGEFTTTEGTHIGVLVVDISEVGIGFICETKFGRDQEILFRWPEQNIADVAMIVVWSKSQPDEDMDGMVMYRCGATLVNHDQNLVNIVKRCDSVALEDLE
jgi:hypothetical protein